MIEGWHGLDYIIRNKSFGVLSCCKLSGVLRRINIPYTWCGAYLIYEWQRIILR